MAFGARVLKTGIAVTLSLYISMLFEFQLPVIAAVAAIFAMQPSIYRSWRHFLDQLQTNTLGAAMAMLAGMFLSKDPFAIGIVCILAIMICLKLKMEETIGLTLVTVIVVMEASGQWDFALTRFLLSLIGIGSAFIINVLFFPPKPKEQFVKQIQTVFNKLSLLLRTFVSDEIKESVFRQEKQALENEVKSLAQKYSLFEEDLKKLKKSTFSQIRHLVVYKQMLTTLHKGIEVLDAVEQHYFQAARTPEIDAYFDLHLEMFIKYHEHVLLKFGDKLKPDSSENEKMEQANDDFMKTMIKSYSEEREGVLRLSIVTAAMYDYCFQIGRLDKQVEQFNSKSPEEKETVEKLISWFKK
ncbi:aromatic acid exporter family protein [Paenibacillus sp. LMG 31456]|uniref:Aromatic acid exporter family protein n=1 Tax=Paenibacillus foliorum TaxID=2654974 RepID=A0A972GU99_9BACL|nr:aromatic acid exporter family protein [Paenibacillus foliorum]NOU96994.1 aromatic acid exporter family protein [Paenibacillus foliorum]